MPGPLAWRIGTIRWNVLPPPSSGSIDAARSHGSRATFGRVQVTPNSTNAIPSQVTAWLDARAATEEGLEALVGIGRYGGHGLARIGDPPGRVRSRIAG